LRASKTSARLINSSHRHVLEILAVQISEVWLLLPLNCCVRAFDDLLGDLDSGFFGFLECDQHRRVNKTDRATCRLFALSNKIVVAPATINRLVVFQHLDLTSHQLVNLFQILFRLISHRFQTNQGLNCIGVRPNVVNRIALRPFYARKFFEHPLLRSLD
jgi:hypothetical protein